MSFYSRSLYSQGGLGTYAVTFPYIDRAHVVVLDNGATYSGSITWTPDNRVTLSPDIVSGHTVEIRRVTPRTQALVVFTPGTVNADDLNLGETQDLYLMQEILDLQGVSSGGSSGGDTGGTGGTGGTGTTITEMPDFVAVYNGVGDGTTSNDAAFTAAEGSAYPVIWLAAGNYLTSFPRTAFFKKYRGPGKIYSNNGDQILVGFASTQPTPVGTRMPFGPSQTSFDGIPGTNYGLGGETNLPDMRYEYIAGGRENVVPDYLRAGAFGQFSVTWNESGGSGTTAMLAATASTGATTATLNSVANVGVGTVLAFCQIDGATPTDTVTVTDVNATTKVITFTPALANTYTWLGSDYFNYQAPRVTHAMRTMNGHEFAILHHNAGGDAYLWFGRVFVEYQKLAGQPTNFQTATGGMIGGDMNAKSSGIYITGWECNYLDNGFDAGVVGTVNSYNRTNNTGAMNAFWIGVIEKVTGSVPIDGFYVMQGKAHFGIDMVGADFSSVAQQAINLSTGQRIVFNSIISNAQNASARGWWGDICGDVFLSHTKSSGNINRLTVNAGGKQIAHFQANHTIQLFEASITDGQLSVNGDIYCNGANKICVNQGGKFFLDGYPSGTCYMTYNGTNIQIVKAGTVVAQW